MRSDIILQYRLISESPNLVHCHRRVSYMQVVFRIKCVCVGHYVRPQLGFHRKLAKSGRPLSDDEGGIEIN